MSEETATDNPASAKETPVPESSASRNLQISKGETFGPFRFVYPEFLPDPRLDWRNRIREKLERIDMLRRRSNIDIPEFYVGMCTAAAVSFIIEL